MSAAMHIVADLVEAEKHRQAMLEALTRAYVSTDYGYPRWRETRAAVEKARGEAFVDGDGGPLPDLIQAAVLAAAREGIEAKS